MLWYTLQLILRHALIHLIVKLALILKLKIKWEWANFQDATCSDTKTKYQISYLYRQLEYNLNNLSKDIKANGIDRIIINAKIDN